MIYIPLEYWGKRAITKSSNVKIAHEYDESHLFSKLLNIPYALVKLLCPHPPWAAPGSEEKCVR